MQTCTKKPSVFLDISSIFLGILNIEATKRYFWLEKILVTLAKDTKYEYGLKTKYNLNPTSGYVVNMKYRPCTFSRIFRRPGLYVGFKVYFVLRPSYSYSVSLIKVTKIFSSQKYFLLLQYSKYREISS